MNLRLSFAKVALLTVGLTASLVRADTVSVLENGVGANETVVITSSSLGNDLHVYAGVLDLVVGGTATTGFCIDPWHWSSGSTLEYTYEDLSWAPKSADNTATSSAMGAATALQIEQLWEKYYTSSISNVTAAALQIEIWQLVDAAANNGYFELKSVDNDWAAVADQIKAMNDFLAQNPNAAHADLIAITSPGGQDYVIKNVPDAGSSLTLFGLALIGLVAIRRKSIRG